jgi:hypothetical protein
MTPAEIARRLRKLADDMTETGGKIARLDGPEAPQHGREMIHAAVIARQWAGEIDSMQPHAAVAAGEAL